MKKYEYNNETFEVDDSGCDGSSGWEVKVSDGKNTASVKWNCNGNSVYRVTLVESNTRWDVTTPKEALDQACRALIQYRAKTATSHEDACKALVDYVNES